MRYSVKDKMIETQNMNSLIADQMLKIFQDYRQDYVESNYKVIVSHFGEFSQDLVNSLVESNDALMTSLGDSKIVRKRTFSILIEGLQNIRKHAEIDTNNKKVAFLIIAKSEQDYILNFGNIIFKTDSSEIINHINYINSLEEGNLKSFYLKELSENVLTQKGGAGLGFIIMKMKSGNELNPSIKALDDDKSLLSVEVKIFRN